MANKPKKPASPTFKKTVEKNGRVEKKLEKQESDRIKKKYQEYCMATYEPVKAAALRHMVERQQLKNMMTKPATKEIVKKKCPC